MRKKNRLTPRKDGKQSRARETVEAILTATTHILERSGYDHLTTNKIATEAGVSIGSLYQYFPTKEAIVGILAQRHMGRLQTAFLEKLSSVATAPIPVIAREIVKAMFDVHRIAPRLHRVLVEETPRIGKYKSLQDVLFECKEYVATFMRQRIHEIDVTDVDLAAMILVQSVDSLVKVALTERREFSDLETVEREITKLILRYLGARNA